jgi:pimeloyl-ACP methyl ester carboxylesterase
MRRMNRSALVVLSFFLLGAGSGAGSGDGVHFGAAAIGNGVVLHYAEEGHGTPVVFIHGSLSDYGYWKDAVDTFSKTYHAIAYSRRYNFPNDNPAASGYSAITDADDLAAFLKTLHLHKVVLVGHSYGALVALFAAIRHPDSIAALVLAEPPAVSLLSDLPGSDAGTGRAMLSDIHSRMVQPMKAAFSKNERERGVAIFIDYVFNNPHAWDEMPASSRENTLRDAHEWDVMMTKGTLFPAIAPRAIEAIHVPVLLMSGTRTYPFLTKIDYELARLLPDNENLIIHGAGHQMWYQQTQVCVAAVQTFLRWATRR